MSTPPHLALFYHASKWKSGEDDDDKKSQTFLPQTTGLLEKYLGVKFLSSFSWKDERTEALGQSSNGGRKMWNLNEFFWLKFWKNFLLGHPVKWHPNVRTDCCCCCVWLSTSPLGGKNQDKWGNTAIISPPKPHLMSRTETLMLYLVSQMSAHCRILPEILSLFKIVRA